MEFTDRELQLLSDSLIRSMQAAYEAKRLVQDEDVHDTINFYTAELRALNTKICNHMEG